MDDRTDGARTVVCAISGRAVRPRLLLDLASGRDTVVAGDNAVLDTGCNSMAFFSWQSAASLVASRTDSRIQPAG
ncbi:MAG: hypothetical protein KDI01_07995 [Halioglobus sp.]|nr:hypothetical protein [Halioglobus sp.]